MRIEWNDKDLIKKSKKAAEVAARKGAALVVADANRMCPVDTGNLRNSISPKKSKFKDGGFIVEAYGDMGKKRYYATQVEFGAQQTESQPFLRPALNKNRVKINEIYQKELNAL